MTNIRVENTAINIIIVRKTISINLVVGLALREASVDTFHNIIKILSNMKKP